MGHSVYTHINIRIKYVDMRGHYFWANDCSCYLTQFVGRSVIAVPGFATAVHGGPSQYNVMSVFLGVPVVIMYIYIYMLYVIIHII